MGARTYFSAQFLIQPVLIQQLVVAFRIIQRAPLKISDEEAFGVAQG